MRRRVLVPAMVALVLVACSPAGDVVGEQSAPSPESQSTSVAAQRTSAPPPAGDPLTAPATAEVDQALFEQRLLPLSVMPEGFVEPPMVPGPEATEACPGVPNPDAELYPRSEKGIIYVREPDRHLQYSILLGSFATVADAERYLAVVRDLSVACPVVRETTLAGQVLESERQDLAVRDVAGADDVMAQRFLIAMAEQPDWTIGIGDQLTLRRGRFLVTVTRVEYSYLGTPLGNVRDLVRYAERQLAQLARPR